VSKTAAEKRNHMADNLSDDEIEREVQKRKDAATSLGLPAIIEFVFEEIKDYPDWKEKFPERCLAEIENPREALINKVGGVAFFFKGHEYALGKSEEDTLLPDLEVWTSRNYFLYNANRKLLFSIRGSVADDGHYGYSFTFHEITAYIPGEWTEDIVKLLHLLKEHRDRQHAEWEAKSASEKLKKLRSNFRL